MTYLCVMLYIFAGLLMVKAINRFDREYPLQISIDNDIDNLFILVVVLFWPAVLAILVIAGSMYFLGWILSKLKIIEAFNKVIK